MFVVQCSKLHKIINTHKYQASLFYQDTKKDQTEVYSAM